MAVITKVYFNRHLNDKPSERLLLLYVWHKTLLVTQCSDIRMHDEDSCNYIYSINITLQRDIWWGHLTPITIFILHSYNTSVHSKFNRINVSITVKVLFNTLCPVIELTNDADSLGILVLMPTTIKFNNISSAFDCSIGILKTLITRWIHSSDPYVTKVIPKWRFALLGPQ